MFYSSFRYAFVSLLLALGVLSSCDWIQEKSGSTKGSKEIVLGYVDTFSGSRADFGNSVRNGIFLAINKYNATKGAKGKQIRMMVLDDQGQAKNTAKLTESLIENYDIMALFGAAASSRSLKMGPVAQKHKIPMVAASSTHPDVTQVGDQVFRVCFIDSFQGEVMATYLYQKGIRKVAVLTDQGTEYSVALAEFFKKKFRALGGKVLIEKNYTEDLVNFASLLTAIKATKPEALYIPGFYVDVSRIAQQARKIGLSAQLAGGDGWDSNELTKLGSEALEGSVYTSHYSIENPDQNFQNFKKQYEKQYGRTPNAFAALGYDAAQVVLHAIDEAKSHTPKAIRDAIARTENYPGVTGQITLNEKRNAIKPAVIVKIENGKPKFLETVNP